MMALARAVMRLAAHCLGGARHEWALSMQAEFEAASEDGKPLSFAWGCLLAAWCELPAHEEGRFTISNHLLAFALIIPTAALLAATIFANFPFPDLGPIMAHTPLDQADGRTPLLSAGNRSAVPSLAALVILLAVSHLRIAWLVLERDWARVAALGKLMAAATATFVIFTLLVFDHYPSALTQATALAIELIGISALARWHRRSLGGASDGQMA